MGVGSLVALTPDNVIGIPKVERAALVNALTCRMDVNDAFPTMTSRPFDKQVTESNSASINQFRKIANQQVESTGLRTARGGFARAFLLAQSLFQRYAWNTPKYQLSAFLSTVVIELGDYVTLSHPLVPDMIESGQLGISNVVCEVISRQPDYANGRMEFTMLDTRAFGLGPAFQVVPDSGVPTWASATAAERAQYMFIASATGENSDGSLGNTIF